MTSSEDSFLARSMGSMVDPTIMSVHWTRTFQAASQSVKEVLLEPAYEMYYQYNCMDDYISDQLDYLQYNKIRKTLISKWLR